MIVTDAGTARGSTLRPLFQGWLLSLAIVAFGSSSAAFAQRPAMPRTASLADLSSSSAARADVSAPGTLPRVLGAGDEILYRRIATAQEAGDWPLADRLILGLTDRRLLGHVLADRYLDKRYATTYPDAKGWLALYSDLPQAAQIYRLALKRKPNGTDRALKRPLAAEPITGVGDDEVAWRDRPTPINEAALDPGLKRELVRAHAMMDHGDLDAARLMLDGLTTRTAEEQRAIDAARGDLAQAYAIVGKDAATFAVGMAALRSSADLPSGPWWAALAAWRMGRKADAQKLFEAVATAPASSSWRATAASFWAARAAMARKDVAREQEWLSRAAQNPYSFYGLIARQRLGWPINFDWSLPELHDRDLATLERYPGVLRALALVQLGELDLAEDELRQTYSRLPSALIPNLMTVAERGGMPGLAYRLGAQLLRTRGVRYDAALYPIPPWRPPAGFALNPALLYAIARQESHFDPDATSPKGAAGLMQLMPATAADMGARLHAKRPTPEVYEPSINIGLAQRLIDQLLGSDGIRSSLVHMAVAYNAGPGTLQRWQERFGDTKDPLLFLESLPSTDVRVYTARVLTNFWIYQIRLSQRAESLEQLAAGSWPIYTPDPNVRVAERRDGN